MSDFAGESKNTTTIYVVLDDFRGETTHFTVNARLTSRGSKGVYSQYWYGGRGPPESPECQITKIILLSDEKEEDVTNSLSDNEFESIYDKTIEALMETEMAEEERLYGKEE